jgi:hypothetical protein
MQTSFSPHTAAVKAFRRRALLAVLLLGSLAAPTCMAAAEGPVVEIISAAAQSDTTAVSADGFSFARLSYTADPLAPGEGRANSAGEKKDEKPPRVFHFSFRLGGRFVYSDNINASSEDPVEDFYVSLEPGVSIGLGDVPERKGNYIRLDYSPNALLYFENSEFNTLSHFIHLEAVAHFGKLTLSLFQDVNLLEGVNSNFESPNNFGDQNRDRDRFRGNRDISGRNTVEIYSTNAIAKYDFTEKAWMTGAFHYTLTDYEDVFRTELYSGDLFFDYKVTPELTVGVGGAGGVVNHDDPTIDEQFQEARTRFTFDLPKKININGSLGLEFRQLGRDAEEGYVAPIIEANVSFEPADGTRITINARHRTLVSNALEGQHFTITGANVGLRQRITERIDFDVKSGYEQASYASVMPGVEAMRRDEYFFVEPSLEWRITDKWNAAIYYIHRENVTNLQPFGFAENQVGLRTSISF